MSDKHQKATEIINNANYIFSRKVTSFAEAYPSVAKLRVEIAESSGWSGEETPWVLTESTFRQAVDCSNRACYGGGVELGWILHDMVSKHLTTSEETKPCRGYEGSPKGRKRYGACLHSFRVKVEIEYKKEDSATGEAPAIGNVSPAGGSGVEG